MNLGTPNPLGWGAAASVGTLGTPCSRHGGHLLGIGWMLNLLLLLFQSRPTLCDLMNRSTPGLPVHHQLPEFTQIHVHRVSDANPAILFSVIPFSSCPQSLPASQSFPMSQLFTRGGQSTGASALASFLPKKSHSYISFRMD